MSKEVREAVKRAHEVRSKIATMLVEEDVDVGVALAVLCAMAIDCGLRQAELEPHDLISKLVRGTCEVYEALVEEREEEKEEEDEQAISRTTH